MTGSTYRCRCCNQDKSDGDIYVDDDGIRRFRPHSFRNEMFDCPGSRAPALTPAEHEHVCKVLQSQVRQVMTNRFKAGEASRN